jgi:predicted restriction endonuclease
MLEQYLLMFAKLRTDRSRDRYPTITYHRAPHKPFLLLSIIDLIAEGRITQNLTEPSYELADTFNTYRAAVMPLGTTTSMAYPFPRLKTEGFWHLVPNSGFEAKIDMDFSSMTRLRQVCAGAKMDEELFGYLCNPETSERLRAVLIEVV